MASMGDARAYLPTECSTSAIQDLLTTLSLPIASTITLHSSTAAYHIIYKIAFSSHQDLILRIAGSHFPEVKTSNEVGILHWLRAKTSIPVPEVIAYDDSTANVLGLEFLLMTCAAGQSFDTVEASLKADGTENSYSEHLSAYMEQISIVLSELASHTWSHIGGLQLSSDGKDVVPGPVIDESLWMSPEIPKFWADGVVSSDVNISGPYDSWPSLLAAQLQTYLFALTHHDSLRPLQPLLPIIQQFQSVISSNASIINQLNTATKLILAHRDLHFGNVMWNISSKKITAILDWEFAAVVPAQRWDPSRAFMWDPAEPGDNEGKYARVEEARTLMREDGGGAAFWDDVMFKSQLQEDAVMAVNFLRVIVEVLVRGQGADRRWEGWRDSMVLHMQRVISACIEDDKKRLLNI